MPKSKAVVATSAKNSRGVAGQCLAAMEGAGPSVTAHGAKQSQMVSERDCVRGFNRVRYLRQCRSKAGMVSKGRESSVSSRHQGLSTRHESEEDITAKQELCRKQIRSEIVNKFAGDAKKAFKKMDVTGNGQLSVSQFAGSVCGIGIDWLEITGLKKDRELFKLFDLDKDGVVSFAELFPEASEDSGQAELCFEKFLDRWHEVESQMTEGLHEPLWESLSPESQQRVSKQTFEAHQKVAERRKWMRATVRCMKDQGKSDAECRELAATHLPRGTRPKDSHDAQAFSTKEVSKCRKAYGEELNSKVRNISTSLYEMRTLRHLLHGCRQTLSSATSEQVQSREQTNQTGAEKSDAAVAKQSDNA